MFTHLIAMYGYYDINIINYKLDAPNDTFKESCKGNFRLSKAGGQVG